MAKRLVTKTKICMSIDTDTLKIFHATCDRAGLAYSQVVETLMVYFVDLERQAQDTELASDEQGRMQES